MSRYLLRRLLALIPTSFGVLLLTFVLFNMVGGSSAHVALGQHADESSIRAFNALHGLDKPLLVGRLGDGAFPENIQGLFDSQLANYIGSVLKGDFGYSVAYGARVADVLKAGVGPSLSITVPILLGGTLVSLFLAMLASLKRGGAADRAVLFASTLFMSVNYVVWILLGQFLLSYKLGAFPIWGYEGAGYVVLPVMIGILGGLGKDIRYFRTVLLEEASKPYLRTAYSKGLGRGRVFFGHLLPNAMIPVVTYVSLSVPYLFTGSLLLERFFGIPGLGEISINAIHSGDVSTIRAVVILGSLLYQLVHLATDVCYAWLDPRVVYDS